MHYFLHNGALSHALRLTATCSANGRSLAMMNCLVAALGVSWTNPAPETSDAGLSVEAHPDKAASAAHTARQRVIDTLRRQ